MSDSKVRTKDSISYGSDPEAKITVENLAEGMTAAIKSNPDRVEIRGVLDGSRIEAKPTKISCKNKICPFKGLNIDVSNPPKECYECGQLFVFHSIEKSTKEIVDM